MYNIVKNEGVILICRLIPKDSKYHYHLVLGSVFLFVSLLILATSMFVTAYYQLNAIHKEFDSSAIKTLKAKKNFLSSQTNHFKTYLQAVDSTLEFDDFIKNSSKNIASKEHIKSIMMAVSQSNPDIMQFRFIDSSGFESLRIDRDFIGKQPYVVDEKNLQNKADRYYFKDIKKLAQSEVWFSKIDLNTERGKITKPLVPTIRVAKPYYFNGEFKGILIVNVFMEKILKEIMQSDLFNVAILDKNSYFLTNNLSGYNSDQKEWTRYLKTKSEVKYKENQNADNFFIKFLFEKKYSTVDISKIVENDDGLQIIIEEKIEKFIEHAKNIVDYIAIMVLVVFIIAFPVAILLSRYPLKLHNELKESRDDLEHQLDIIDQYVYMSITDLDGNILEVSTAFENISGYSKDELIGQKLSIIKSQNTPNDVYKNMWEKILLGKKWSGELENTAKDGKSYWIKNNITPIFSPELSGFTLIGEDITAQKIIEEISIKDELTQAYNRRYFNQIFPIELQRAKREKGLFNIAMLDIDYFKKYNDTYGHLEGDNALKAVVSHLSKKLQRAGDYLFRVGGEEFIIIYSAIKTFEEAKEFSSEIVKTVENIQMEHKTSECNNVVTISLGLLSVKPSCEMDVEKILQRIDELLYKSKNNGRNQATFEEC
ncbi:MAG: diguanylate cyclase (GGDEF)-like protein/PAS domain S-box-containing protein [Sulfurimonas sp.]|jgi:diguanylate cyclase (GGDEF)-like protein/PAS domain S-box-containing protein